MTPIDADGCQNVVRAGAIPLAPTNSAIAGRDVLIWVRDEPSVEIIKVRLGPDRDARREQGVVLA